MIVLFAGGSYLDWFPLRGRSPATSTPLVAGEDRRLPVAHHPAGAGDGDRRLRHPDHADQNSFLDEIRKQYVTTARAKGLDEKKILYRHVFRNAMLLVIAGFPATFISMFFTGSLLIEVMFSLNGLGLLGYDATLQRDYPVMFGTLYIFTLIGLLLNILSDITYTLVDPRIDFEARQ